MVLAWGMGSLKNQILISMPHMNDRFFSKSVSLTSDQGALEDLKREEKVPFKLMLGHAGWSAGQLEREIENGDWLIQSTTSDFIFNLPSNQMWEYAAKSIGLDINSSFGTSSGQA